MASNRLSGEKSPYLLQHKDNPVAWRPWGEEAFAEAKRRNVPVFLSIGYSTCHWCHVMAHESFENESIAGLMNEHYVNIKVDREERPDVDRLYMAFVQATTGGGGWPMSVWLTPEGDPFFGGTYFPPEDRYGRAGFPNVLRQIARLWRVDQGRVEREGQRVLGVLTEMTQSEAAEELAESELPLVSGYEQLAANFDEENGGFGGAPKFPRPSVFNFLLRFAMRSEGAERTQALHMALHTLRKMAAGGIRDHLGGGFHRYSVDAFWHVSHFEKMLYDQGQLVVSYVEAWQITKEDVFAEVARETLNYVLREMTHEEGGFFSAEDADSLVEEGKPEHAEGAFYVWTQAEVLEVLGEGAGERFCRHYGVKEGGNAPPGTDPHGEFTDKNILIETLPSGYDVELAASRAKLFARRAKRPRPHRDDKILTAWNGLMISALAKAGAALHEPVFVAAARKAVEFVLRELRKDGKLLRTWRGGAGAIEGFAEDYAFFIKGLLDLYEAEPEAKYLATATELQGMQDALFWDETGGAYYNSPAGDPLVRVRLKEDYDGAEPSANSISALNLLRLGRMLHADEFEAKARRILAAHQIQMQRMPTGVPQMLVALDLAMTAPAQYVVAADGLEEAKPWLEKLHGEFAPWRVILRAEEAGVLPDEARAMKPVEGKAALYVCENFACQAPVTAPELHH